MVSVIYVECRNQALYAECHYAECRYAECHGALILMEILNFDLINGRISSRMTKHFFTAVFTNIVTLVTSGEVELSQLIPQILD